MRVRVLLSKWTRALIPAGTPPHTHAQVAFTSDVVALAFRPDGTEFVISNLDASLSFWNLLTSKITGP